ncbi:zf-RVT domain-containing protein [Cephalotus follicularis]|uniref:Zf-RVT domain-containing protein n=1 Tax=Cephalotus follicularis TaxID=3775 RepID=A0A1Q3DIU3_CEPFO|nr:zf-RVT domain-containing protein [Cephalotus follicularis]
MALLNIQEGRLPVRYLGLPLVASKPTYMDCKILVDKLMRRTSSWMSNSLSFGGRLQLLKSLLFSIQVFWCTTFILPAAVLKECDSILRSFLWHGLGNSKRAGKVAWLKVCRPVTVGGLGIKDSRTWNRAAIMKCAWDICTRKETVWTKWCNEVLLKDKFFWTAPITGNCSWGWRNILASRKFMHRKILYEVKDGSSFSLWFDPWFQGEMITSVYGQRVILDSGLPRTAKVSSVITEDRWDWPLNSANLLEINNTTSLIPLPAGCDAIHWLKRGRMFTIQEAWKAISPHSQGVPWCKVVWFPQRIPKHSFCVWLSFLQGHRTLDKLARMGVVGSSACVFGCGQEESLDHLFFACPYTATVWNFFLAKYGLNRHCGGWNVEASWCIQSLQGNSHKIWLIKLTFAAVMYHCWGERNNRCFNNVFRNSDCLIQEVSAEIDCKCRGLAQMER